MKRHLLAAIATSALLALTATAVYSQEPPKKIPHAGEVKVWEPESNHKPYGQKLIEEMLPTHPDILVLSMHVKPPGANDSVIAFSSIIERIGFPSNHADDLWPAKENFTIVEPIPAHGQYAVYSALFDKNDHIIGSMVLKLKLRDGVTPPEYYDEGMAIRDELKAKIPSAQALFARTKIWPGNDPSDPSAKIFAQQLLEEYVAKFSLKLMVFHCAPEGYPNVDIASNNPKRIGFESGPYDNAVAGGKVSIVEVSPQEGVYELCLPLLDAGDHLLGCVVLQFPYDPAGKASKFFKDAIAIRDEMKTRISNAQELYRLVSK